MVKTIGNHLHIQWLLMAVNGKTLELRMHGKSNKILPVYSCKAIPDVFKVLIKSIYAKVHDSVPALQRHLSKMLPFMLLQSNPTAITVTSKNIPSPKLTYLATESIDIVERS